MLLEKFNEFNLSAYTEKIQQYSVDLLNTNATDEEIINAYTLAIKITLLYELISYLPEDTQPNTEPIYYKWAVFECNDEEKNKLLKYIVDNPLYEFCVNDILTNFIQSINKEAYKIISQSVSSSL